MIYSIRHAISCIVFAFNTCHVDNEPGHRRKVGFQLFNLKCCATIEDLATIIHNNKKKMVTMDNSNTTYDCLRIALWIQYRDSMLARQAHVVPREIRLLCKPNDKKIP